MDGSPEISKLEESGLLESDVGAKFDRQLAGIDPRLHIERDAKRCRPLRPEEMVIREELRQAKEQTLAAQFIRMNRRVTTHSQFDIMLSFMEKHGDLNHPCDGPRGRATNAELWTQLTQILNSSGSGDPKAEERWKKVWSDFKNKTKKKAVKILKAANGNGGVPADEAGSFNEMEQRVLTIMNLISASGLQMPEQSFEEEPVALPDSPPFSMDPQPEDTAAATAETPMSRYVVTQDWGTLSNGGSSPPPALQRLQPAAAAPAEATEALGTTTDRRRSPVGPASPQNTRRRRRRNNIHSPPSQLRRMLMQQTASERVAAHSLDSDREWREYQRRRDEEDRRFREESEIRREAMEHRWQELFARYIDVLERSIPQPELKDEPR